VMAQAGCTR